jgi:origin recognition complex subunit 1
VVTRDVPLTAAENPPTPSKRARADETQSPAASARKKSAQGRVTIETIRRAIHEATTNPLQQYLRTLPFASRLLLAALLMRMQRSGLAESTFGDVLEEMQRCLKLSDGGRPLTLLTRGSIDTADSGTMTWKAKREVQSIRPSGMSNAAVDLTGAGIINLEAQRPERPSKIKLAVGDEEVRLAFRDDPEIKALGIVL